MFGSIGFTELVLVLMIVLIIFGAGKLPQLGEGLGKAIKGFKKSVHEAESLDSDLQQAQPAGTSPEPVVQTQISQQGSTGSFSEVSQPQASAAPPPATEAVAPSKA